MSVCQLIFYLSKSYQAIAVLSFSQYIFVTTLIYIDHILSYPLCILSLYLLMWCIHCIHNIASHISYYKTHTISYISLISFISGNRFDVRDELTTMSEDNKRQIITTTIDEFIQSCRDGNHTKSIDEFIQLQPTYVLTEAVNELHLIGMSRITINNFGLNTNYIQ